MDGKGGEAILACRVMSGASITSVSAHSHLDGGVKDVPGDVLHPTMPGTGDHSGKSIRHDEKIGDMYMLSTVHRVKIEKKKVNL